MAWKISYFLGAQKGERPNSSSYKRMPRAQKSTWQEWPDLYLVMIYLVSISGAIYYGLPQQEQVIQSSSMSGLLRPKSVILILPQRSNKIFSNFMSLNSILFLCRQSKPFNICSMTYLACPSVSVFTFCRQEYRFPFGQYSNPKTIQCLVQNAQRRSMRFQCLMLKRMFFQFQSIFTFLAVVIVSFRINFNAQYCRSSLHRPRQTCENPPLPKNLTIQKSENYSDSQLIGRRSKAGAMASSLIP